MVVLECCMCKCCFEAEAPLIKEDYVQCPHCGDISENPLKEESGGV